MKTFILLILAIVSSTAFAQTRTMKLDADCVKIQDGTCIDKTEFGHLDDVSSNIQDQLDDIAADVISAGSDLTTHESDTTTHGISSAIVGTTESQSLTNKTISADSNTVSNIDTGELKAGVLDTDLTSVSGSDDTIPSAKATKAYVDANAGTGDVVGPASSVDSEVALFSSTTGKLLKRATGTGFAKLSSGVLSASSTVDASTELTNSAPVPNGGTGRATLTANYVLLGNGTSAVQMIAPGTNGNVLTSNGTTWVSSAATASSVPGCPTCITRHVRITACAASGSAVAFPSWETGSWATAVNGAGNGQCSLDITGAFSSAPYCNMNSTNGASKHCEMNGLPTSTSIPIQVQTIGTGLTNDPCMAECVGPAP